jgi:NtrC-family two-component system response regulator AlgB
LVSFVNRDSSPQSPLRILVVDDEANIRTQLSLCLESDQHQVICHGNIYDALTEASWQAIDLVFLDLRLGVDNGMDFIPRLLAESPWAKIVVITAYASIDTAVEAMKRGATDYLPKPFTPAQVRMVTEKVAQQRLLERKVEAIQRAFGELDPESDFPTNSAAMEKSLELARRVAASNAMILIRGELGTGKGRLARAIHAWSNRSEAPFSTIYCNTTNPDAFDAELFGVSRSDAPETAGGGAGRVEACAGGTLLLDEIGQTPLSLQPKLVRLLEDKEYERHNEFKTRKTDVRIVATSRLDLQHEQEQGRLRADLVLACETIRIDIPPLRQRAEDIPLLAGRYLVFFSRENHRSIAGFTSAAMEVLKEHIWPGNIREMRNVIERAVLLCKSDRIGIEHLPQNLLNSPSAHGVGDLVALETIEQLHIRKVVDSMPTLASAAAVLKMHPGTVVRRLKKRSTGPETPS